MQVQLPQDSFLSLSIQEALFTSAIQDLYCISIRVRHSFTLFLHRLNGISSRAIVQHTCVLRFPRAVCILDIIVQPVVFHPRGVEAAKACNASCCAAYASPTVAVLALMSSMQEGVARVGARKFDIWSFY